MRPPPVCALVLGLVLAAGCKPEPHRPDAAPPWWKPMPGEAADWDIQLTAPFNVSVPRAMYTLDLWNAVPAATMLDYGDGKPPVAVPAGAHAGAIAQLHATTPPTIVVCRIGTGTIRLTDPDAVKFPGFAANPPNRPTPVANGSVIGWSRPTADDQERFIDIHAATRAIVAPLIGKRIELAQAIGCDAILSENNALPAYETPEGGHGFAPISYTEYVSWIAELSGRTHDQRISFGLRDATNLSIDDSTPSGNPSQLCDWVMEDRCGERKDCDLTRTLLNRGKAVFEIEYNTDESGGTMRTETALNALCSVLTGVGVRDGIVKDNALSSAFYMRCP